MWIVEARGENGGIFIIFLIQKFSSCGEIVGEVETGKNNRMRERERERER